jgi:hypothetical protein
MARVIVAPSPMLLFNARRALCDGVPVAALVDRKLSEIDRRTSQVETSTGTMVISTALVRLAARQNARIVFFGSRMLEDNAIVMTFRPAIASTPEGVATEMAAFVDQLLSATPRTSRPRRSSDRTTAIRG